MDAAQLDRLVRETVAARPDPPRPVPHWALLEHSLLNGPALVVLAVGALTLLGLSQFVGNGELAPGQDSDLTTFALVVGGLGVGLIGLPLLTFGRLVAMLRRGRPATARVLEVAPADTVAASPHRRGVVGQRLVECATGLFEEPFHVDQPWAGELTEGTELTVIVHPRRRRVLYELAPR